MIKFYNDFQREGMTERERGKKEHQENKKGIKNSGD